MLSKPEWLKHFRILCCEQQNCPNWKLEKHKIFTGLPLYCSSAIKAVKMSFCICRIVTSPPPHPLCASLLWYTWAKCWSIRPLSERLRGISRVLLCSTISCVQCLGCRTHLSNQGVALVAAYSPTPTHSHPPTRTVATSQWWQRMFAQCVLLTSAIADSYFLYFLLCISGMGWFGFLMRRWW